MKRKKIEKERNHFFRDYATTIKAVIVLIILVLLLVGVVLFKPTKKEEIKDPSVLSINEKILNNNDAKCDGPDAIKIKEDASKVFIQYEIVSDYLFGYMAETDTDLNGNGVIDEEPVVENRGYAIKLKLNNITDNIYVQISNDIDDDVKVLRKSNVDENNLVIWYEKDNNFIRTYDVKIYSARTGCTSELYREFTTSLPRYNLLSRSYDCEVEPTKDFDICQPFLWEDRTYIEDANEFKKVMREYVQKQAREEKEQKEKEEAKEEETIKDKIIRLVKENYIIVAGAAIALIIIILLIVKRVKKK